MFKEQLKLHLSQFKLEYLLLIGAFLSYSFINLNYFIVFTIANVVLSLGVVVCSFQWIHFGFLSQEKSYFVGFYMLSRKRLKIVMLLSTLTLCSSVIVFNWVFPNQNQNLDTNNKSFVYLLAIICTSLIQLSFSFCTLALRCHTQDLKRVFSQISTYLVYQNMDEVKELIKLIKDFSYNQFAFFSLLCLQANEEVLTFLYEKIKSLKDDNIEEEFLKLAKMAHRKETDTIIAYAAYQQAKAEKQYLNTVIEQANISLKPRKI